MRKNKIEIALLLLVISLIAGCLSSDEKYINPRISLWYKDKIPYGTWFAYNSLERFYPLPGIVNLQKISPENAANFQAYYWVKSDYEEPVQEDSIPDEAVETDEQQVDESFEQELYLVVSPQFYPNEKEIEKLLGYVGYGNHLVIAAFDFSNDFLDTLSVKLEIDDFDFKNKDSVIFSVRSSTDSLFKTYGYPGLSLGQYFASNESTEWEVLGKNQNGKPNIIRIRRDSGTITLHANPLQLTNFFLLHKNNHSSWSNLLAGLPDSYSTIWWDEYYRHADPNQSNFSSLGVLMKYPSLRWALYTTLIMLGLLLISELKRRRKVIPVLPALENSSLDFVKTIGRLYYQHKDNQDLAKKIESHFREFIRNHYNITSNQPDSVLAAQLSLKSGVEEGIIKSILNEFKLIDEHGTVSDDELLHINELIENFQIKRS